MAYKDLLNALTVEEDPVRAEHSTRYFKTGEGEYGHGDIFVGITMPQLRKICAKHRGIGIVDLQKLLDSPVHEYRMAAVVIMSDTYKTSSPVMQDDLYLLYMRNTRGDRINNWDLVDVSAPSVVGEYLLDKDPMPLYELACSDHLWSKRVAILSTFAFLHAGDPTHTIAIAKILLHDPHDLIQKAVGWLLREMGKQVDEGLLEDFLNAHAKEMPRTMLRYSLERLSVKQKKHYMSA